MDPEEALKQLRFRMKKIQAIIDDNVDEESGHIENEEALDALEDTVDEAVNLWNGLDNWMSSSGFLPGDWAKGR